MLQFERSSFVANSLLRRAWHYSNLPKFRCFLQKNVWFTILVAERYVSKIDGQWVKVIDHDKIFLGGVDLDALL
jgi:hypothetical protein